MSYLNLFTLIALALNFSGQPTPIRPRIESVHIRSVIPVREEDAESIPWVFERRLKWEDFKMAPRRQNEAVASTSTTLGLAYQVENGQLTYHITCYFSKHKSWGLLKTDYILAHEQGHFDITEVYARKLHEALQHYTLNRRTFKADVNAIYNAIVKEKEEMQAKYDGESDHSRSRTTQYDWFEKIDRMLQDSELWSLYP